MKNPVNLTSYSQIESMANFVSAVGSDSYGFDVFGNIVSDATRSFSFDWNNRLAGLTKSSVTTSYEYDEEGIRTKKTTPSKVTQYIEKYTEIDDTNVIRHIFAGNKRIASIDGAAAVTYNHEDHLGSSRLRTDSSGSVVKRVEYLPFGAKRTQSGSYDLIKNRYTGQYEDEESDLYYYGKRYYDPVLSRFVSADPLYLEKMDEKGTDSQELNLFAYVKNNPIKFIDPTGEESYLASRDAIFSRIPFSHNYIVVVQSPLKPEVYSFGPAKDGSLQNISNDKSISTNALDSSSWLSGRANYQIINATDADVRGAVGKVSSILEVAKIDYKYPTVIEKIYNSNTAAQAVANTAQGSDVKAPSSSLLGPVGAENSSDISGPRHESE